MQIVIPCGGLATRLHPLTKLVPKSLVMVAGKPFLQHQIELVRKQNINDIVLCTGHLGKMIRDYFGDGSNFDVRITYSDDNGKLGTIGAVRRAKKLLNEHFYLMYGDSYLPDIDLRNMFDKYMEHGDAIVGMIAAWKNKDKIDRSNLVVHDGMLIKTDTPDAEWIDYGVSIFPKKAIMGVPWRARFSTREFREMFLPLWNIAIYKVDKRFYHIGNMDGLMELEELLGGESKIVDVTQEFG